MPVRRRPRYLHRYLAHHVRQRRHQAGISQEQLADRSDLHRTYVGAIERAERNVSLTTLEALVDALDTAPAELISPVGPEDAVWTRPKPG